uniref:DUF547 domain-containing protein n=1 Tax=Zea mays TaxID=4577 RepID=B6SKK7_MAIZE|nr:hypothetical protein [Zea mays]|eukprot:NP_001142597.1 uncharacterized protein LOC100274864 [Zea mays]
MDYVVARMQLQQAAVPPPVHSIADHRPPPVSQRTRGSATMQRQRREALEQEVAELKQQLSNEQTVHQILERALQPSSSMALANIPAFIPTKAKELLAELLLVEEEIARLEDQIKRMKKSAATQQQQQTEHCKSMFFISQAMDGEAYLSTVVNNKRHSLASSSDGHAVLEKKIAQHELPITKKSPTVIAKRRARDQQQPPNKLSERILKCLVCIFMRLLRSSRASESAAGNLGGFRMDMGLVNLAAAAAAKEKERGQQDHYGIFGIQDSMVRDIGPYKNLVRFTTSAGSGSGSGSLDLHLLSRGFSASPLVSKLREMLEALQQVDVRSLNHHQRLAFWLNIYNTCIMHGILQHGLPSNSDKLLALKNKATINVSGQTFNALVIENFILRQPSSVKQELWQCDVDVEEEQAVREVYGLKTSEPNILFALCCGIRSSPALRIYKADRVLVDLDKAKLEYLQASLVVTSTRRLMIPSLLHSNMHDFAKDTESLLRWICEQLPTSWSLRKSMVDCLAAITNNKLEEVVVDVIPLDYDFQYLLPM